MILSTDKDKQPSKGFTGGCRLCLLAVSLECFDLTVTAWLTVLLETMFVASVDGMLGLALVLVLLFVPVMSK